MLLPSRIDYFSIGREFVRARARKVDPDQVDVEGSDLNLYVGAASFIAEHITRQLADRFAATLLDGAQGEDLPRLGQDRYRIAPKNAAAAVVTVRHFRPTSAGGPGSIPAGRRIFSLTNAEYVTTTTATFATTQLQAFSEARATSAGKEFQVGRNQLRRYAEPGLLFDPTIEPTNDEPAAGGEPAEAPDEYRERIRAFWLAARRGTKGAIELGARSVPGVSSAFAAEALDASARPARVVRLAIADSSGISSQAQAREVSAVLLEWRACGIFVAIDTSLPQIVPIRLRLRFDGGTGATASLAENVRAATVEFVNSLGAGQTLFRVSLGSVLERYRASGLRPDQDTIVEPAGDVVPAPGRTLRTRVENVTIA